MSLTLRPFWFKNVLKAVSDACLIVMPPPSGRVPWYTTKTSIEEELNEVGTYSLPMTGYDVLPTVYVCPKLRGTEISEDAETALETAGSDPINVLMELCSVGFTTNAAWPPTATSTSCDEVASMAFT